MELDHHHRIAAIAADEGDCQEKSEDKNSSHARTKPYRMLKQVIQQGRRREITGGVPSGYVEDYFDPRTQLGTCLSILL
ncbi:MAG: hypothetical protein A2V62_09070 [Nitrospirae bacterium RBG_19FT_COMBO_58_9]|nr:MAG: hypothetical protein A2V62_09070 [Nitrospirae bacterium RBG_19FT_COMBO_58_9]